MAQPFYDDIVFPESISLYAFKGKVMRKTRRISTDSGSQSRLSIWGSSLRSYDAGLVARPRSQWEQIEALFEVVAGPAIGFLLRDVTDYQASATQGAFAPISATVFAFQKRYLVGTRAVYRGIAKPKSGSIVVYRTTNLNVTNVVLPANVTIDYANGRATFSAAYLAPTDVVSWTGDFYVPIQFDMDELDWQMVDRSGSELVISGPSVPLLELRWPGMPYRIPDIYP